MRSHYSTFQDRFGLWVFTSPLGKHGPFREQGTAGTAAMQVFDVHHKRSYGEGAEAALLRAYFQPQQQEGAR